MIAGFRDFAKKDSDGFTLVEVVIVIMILAILATLAMPYFHDILSSSSASTALANLEHLNQSVLKFNQANWELVLTNPDVGTTNEELIARSLQYRGAESTASPGSPYLDPTLAITGTDGASTYRASWNGRMFQMIEAGTAGSGLDLLRMTSTGTGYIFPVGYKPVGAP